MKKGPPPTGKLLKVTLILIENRKVQLSFTIEINFTQCS